MYAFQKIARSHSFAGVAQPVEQLIRNQQVVCSSHITSSMSPSRFLDGDFSVSGDVIVVKKV